MEQNELGKTGLSRSAKTAIAASFIGWTLVNVDSSFFTYTYPLMQKEFGITDQQISWIYTGIYLIGAVSAFLAGPLMDKLGRKFVFMTSLFSNAVGSILLFFSAGFGTVFGFKALTQIGATNEFLAGQIMVAEDTPAKSRGWWIGVCQCGWPFGWFIAALLAMVMIPAFGWRSVFLVGILPGVFALIISRHLKDSDRFMEMKRIRAAKQHQSTDYSTIVAKEKYEVDTTVIEQLGYRQLFQGKVRRSTIVILLVTLASNWGVVAILSWLPLIFTHRNLPLDGMYSMSAWATGLGIIGYLTSSKLGETIGRRESCAIYTALGGVAGIALAFWANTWLTMTICYMVWYFFALGAFPSFYAYSIECLPTRVRGSGGSLLSAFTWAAYVLAGICGPYMMDRFGSNITILIWAGIMEFVASVCILAGIHVKPGTELEDVSI